MTKNLVWSLLIVAVIGGLAYPKLKPLWAREFSKSTVGAEYKNSGKTEIGERRSVGANEIGKSDTAKKDQLSKKSTEPIGKPAAPLKVSTFLVTPSLFTETITATRTVLADEGVELQPETNGKIVSINFVEGAPVKQGDLLLKLNDSHLRANLDRYNYSKKLAEVRFRRYSQLLKQKMVSQDDYDNALSEMNVQQSYIDLYEAEIQKTEIRAPFNGVVGLRYVSVGAFVNASTRIATLQRLSDLKIDFAVPEKYAGRIVALDPRIDSGTRTLLVRATSANTDGRLLPGAFTNVFIALDQIDNAFLIPAEAVVAGLDEKNVFVIEDGVSERRAVETGSRTATQVHIVSGLQAGDEVITSGIQQMRAKMPVESLVDNRSLKAEATKVEAKKNEGSKRGKEDMGAGQAPAKPQSNTTSLFKKAQFDLAVQVAL